MNNKKNLNIYTVSLVIFLVSILFIPAKKAFALTGVSRLFGIDRYETAIEISKEGWDKSENVVLATGNDFPDALSAAPLAKQLNAPIILTDGKKLDNSLKAELLRLKAKNIYIVGAEAAISNEIQHELESYNYIVKRLSGDDRYETSIEIANYTISQFNVSDKIVVVSGEGFADALSIAPIAANLKMPIILSSKYSLSGSAKAYIVKNKISKSYVIGGENVIKSDVIKELPGAERVAGEDRLRTNIAVLTRFSDNINFEKVYISTGSDFPDALAGSALAPKTLSAIMLVDKTLSAQAYDFMSSRQSVIKQITALGGDKVVPNSVLYDNVYGNSQGNINNFGLVSVQNNMIYYNNTSLYKSKLDGTQKTKISEDMPVFINVIGEWIYYVNVSDNLNNIYRIRTDGTVRTKLSSDISLYMVVADNWIYYMNASDGGKIYKMKTDGTSKVKLTDEVGVNINVSGDFVYYITEQSMTELHRINIDGSNLKNLYSGNLQIANVYDNLIYFESATDDLGNNGGLWKMNTDGSNLQKISDVSAKFINVAGNWIYYADASDKDKLYKIKTDGSAKTKLADDAAMFIQTAGDWIYYGTSADDSTYKIKMDGTDRQIVN